MTIEIDKKAVLLVEADPGCKGHGDHPDMPPIIDGAGVAITINGNEYIVQLPSSASDDIMTELMQMREESLIDSLGGEA